MTLPAESKVFSALATRDTPIEYSDAVQIFLWLYCTTDVLPAQLKSEVVSTEKLVEIFEKLSRLGLIGGTPIRPLIESGSSETAWSKLPREFLAGRVSLDETFPERLHTFFPSLSSME